MQVQSQPRPPQFAPPHHQYVLNGQVPGVPPQPVQLPPQQKIVEKAGVRILCIADVRGMFPMILEASFLALVRSNRDVNPFFFSHFSRESSILERAGKEGERGPYPSYW